MPDLYVRHAPVSASVVRESVAIGLSRAGVADDDTYHATLLASELVGNAVRHAPPLPSGELVICWQVAAGGCKISVTDGGTADCFGPVTAAEHDTSGRGLAIVASLAENWGVDSGAAGTTVWAFYRFQRQLRDAGMCAAS